MKLARLLAGFLCTGALAALASCSSDAVSSVASCVGGADEVECTCADGTESTAPCSGDQVGVCDCGATGNDVGILDGYTEPDIDEGIDATSDADATGDADVLDCDDPQTYWPDSDFDTWGDQDGEPVEACEAPEGYAARAGDCDDTQELVYPDAPELCDGLDNDCNREVDDRIQEISLWPDADGDGFGDEDGTPIFDCDVVDGYAPNDDDCNDADDSIRPRVDDLCDSIDNDCDGLTDEDDEFVVYWPDLDEDGYGDADGDAISACVDPLGYAANDEDCLDSDESVNPDGVEVCDLVDNDCDGSTDEDTGLLLTYPDSDDDGFGDAASRPTFSCTVADGFVENNSDCDDLLETVNPLAAEVCNSIDDDCDGDIDEDASDAPSRYGDPDGDGYGRDSIEIFSCAPVEGYADAGGDCNETNAAINPGATETCNGIDDNCDGVTDEGVSNACGVCGPPPTEVCGDVLDNDCDGVIDNGCGCDGRTAQPCYGGPPETLGIGVCTGGVADCLCPGDTTFCTDGTYGTCEGQVLPSEELCDGLDNDCDGETDEGVRNACGECGPAPLEVCDGVDNDCDGAIDEGLRLACGLCPGEEVEEVCENLIDDDCDGLIDEGCVCTSDTELCYPGPPETNGVGVCTPGSRECYGDTDTATPCVGYVLPSVEICDGLDNDCDGIADVDPAGCSVCSLGEEVCDGIDNDCDGQTDEGLRNSCGQCIDSVSPEEAGGPGLCNGVDDDCDGLVDEGLLNACGTCGESCYTESWEDDEDFDGGEFDGTSTEDGIRLNTEAQVFNDLWIANTVDDTVTRINTATNVVIGTYPVGVNAGTNNDNPSRTAVDLNGNAWVANRAFSNQGSVTKIRGGDCVTDCVEFSVNVGGVNGVPRALAIDGEGFVWVGNFNEQRIYRIDPEDGAIVGNYFVGIQPYGFAVDREGILWIATISGQGIGAFDIASETFLGNWGVPGCSQPYGIAVDGDGNIWTGNWQCHGIVRFDRAAWEAGSVSIQRFTHPSVQGTRGVAVDTEGDIWVAASNSNTVSRFDPATNTWQGVYPVCSTPTGVAISRDSDATSDTIWTSCYSSNNANRLTYSGTVTNNIGVGTNPYSYSDMSGFQLRNFTAPRGYWRGIFNCGFDECQFDEATWTAEVPAGTTLTIRFRVSDDGVTWGSWSTTYTSSPAALTLPTGRYVQAEVEMTTTEDEVTPVFRDLDIAWQRP